MTKTSIRIPLALLVTALVGAGSAIAQDRDDPCRRQHSDRPSHCDVRVSTMAAPAALLEVYASPNGGIKVTGANRGDVEVRAIVTTQADTQEAADALARQVQVRAEGGLVRSEGPRRSHDENWSVSFEIAVPNALNLKLETQNGGLSVREVHGRLQLETTNGGITVAGVAGEVRGHTTNGGIDVTLDGGGWKGEGLDLETTNGGVQLRVPENFSAHLEAGTTNGGISVDFPITVQGRITRRISSDIGGGGPTVRLMTVNGGVRVSRR